MQATLSSKFEDEDEKFAGTNRMGVQEHLKCVCGGGGGVVSYNLMLLGFTLPVGWRREDIAIGAESQVGESNLRPPSSIALCLTT